MKRIKKAAISGTIIALIIIPAAYLLGIELAWKLWALLWVGVVADKFGDLVANGIVHDHA